MRRRGVLATLGAVATGGCLGVLGGSGGFTDHREDRSLAFQDVTDAAGLDYSYEERGGGETMEMISNAGVYAADYDNDGLVDVLTLGGGNPVLWHNTGSGFERSGELPTFDETVVTNALFFDHDNDGWEDLLLLRRGETPVFLENDEGNFERGDVGLETAFENPVGATTADYDGDGCLDLFVVQYGLWSETTPKAWNDPFFESDNGNPNVLYRGTCGDGFERADDAGIGPTDAGPHWSLATSFVDIDGNGQPDIHVANDYYNDTVYVNDGDGTFSRQVLGNVTDRNGMSSEVADLTGDGRPDLFVTNIYFDRNRIAELEPVDRRLISNYLSNRLGKRLKGNNVLTASSDGFEDRGDDLGVAEGGWGWAAIAADLDNDGQQDVFHGTQDEIRFDRSNPVYSYPMAWVQRDGTFYRQNASAVGFELTNDRGVARLDYDLDGALDVGIATYDDEYRLYRNDGAEGDSLQVVIDAGDEGTAIGAEVTATIDGDTQTRFHNARADYQSQDSRVVHLGVGDASGVDELRIVWPDGTERAFEDLEAGKRIRVTPDGIQDRIRYDD